MVSRFCGLAGRATIFLAAFAAPAFAADFPLQKDQAAVGDVQAYEASASGNLLDVARKFDVGYVNFMAANPSVDPWSPGAGTTISVPTMFILPDAPRVGIVINLAARELYYFPKDGAKVEIYPVGIGVEDGATPLGLTKIVRKEPDPVWIPPPSIRAERPDLPLSIGPGPDDPLGAFALRTGWTNILIHGTNKPDSVGRNVSHGCFHLYPEDIEKLFNEVAVGTPVRTISQDVAAAWIGDRLYVEVYPTKEQADEIDYGHSMTPAIPQDLVDRVTAVAGDRADEVDWDAVQRAGEKATGLPVAVTGGDVASADR
ncbi:MAG TPA: L,D-transpeptidase family protein [Stellaceae bacterium]|nr:L,D-transpeptidase family protein [Stellaceae bacterium]